MPDDIRLRGETLEEIRDRIDRDVEAEFARKYKLTEQEAQKFRARIKEAFADSHIPIDENVVALRVQSILHDIKQA